MRFLATVFELGFGCLCCGASRLVLSMLAILVLAQQSPAQITRVANSTLTLPQNPQTFGYTTENAFPGISFSQPVGFATPPGETDRLFIIEKTGRIQVITGLNSTPVKQLFLDLSTKVLTASEEGLLGLAFHPDFANNRYFYVFYSTTATTSAGTGAHERVARFTALAAPATNAQILATEVPLISQYDQADNHNGGDLHFGPDGYLYVALGDEGGANDQYNNSQRIDKDFFSGLLRIDVDQRAGNLTPNSHPAVHAGTYRIPADNPFVGASSFNGLAVTPANVRTELWAVGLRNPWRFSFDLPTGRLLAGDVGQGAREEIDLITRGGNYGWSYREGTIAGPRSNPPAGANFINPIWDADRNTAASITGGLVYRGSRFAQLFGQYVFGDYATNRIFAMTFPPSGPVQVQEITTESTPVGFGADPRNGDILIANIGSGAIRRLVYNSTPTGTPLPATLTATGAFSDLAALTPAAGIVAYDPNVSFWSDHAIKRRWFSVPALADKITFAADGNWTFPAGTVWVKHFDLELTRGNPATARRLETRFLVKTAGGVYGVTYRWNAGQTEATLVPEAGADEAITINDAGTIRTQTWHYPSRSECLQCHTPAGGQALSFNTAQLNRSHAYPSGAANQLTTLANAGYFTTPTIPDPATLRALAPAGDASVTLEHRVRSYLAANCVQCHQPGGAAQGNWDARIETPTVNAGLIGGQLINPAGDGANRVVAPGNAAHSMLLSKISMRGAGQMPPLASSELDSADIALVTAWINSLVPPEFTTQPASQSVMTGGSVVFVATASGAPVFQWRKNGINISGATEPSLTLTNVQSSDVGVYTVLASNNAGSVISSAATLTVNAATYPASFDALGYLARNPDVAAAVGNDLNAAWQHYWLYGLNEGRVYDDLFRVDEYLGLYGDLQAVLDNNRQAALLHWLNYGKAEGRLGRVPLTFGIVGYLARYADLQAVFGSLPVAQRNVGVWNHYLNYGVYEGRSDGDLDVHAYLAEYADLSAAFGNNLEAAALHWYIYGRYEGRRIPANFPVQSYLTRYPDIAAAYGRDLYGAWLHYREYGINEGRVYDELFRVDEYLALYADLRAAFGTDREAALLHWLLYGKAEGRRGRF